MALIATMRTAASRQAKRNHRAACQFAAPSRRSISLYTWLMRSTSAAEASSIRRSWSTKPVALSTPGLSLFASILLHLVLIAVMSHPPCQKPFSAFLLEYLVNEPMVMSVIPGDTVEDKAAEREREGPLPHFSQFVIRIALRPHDGNLVNRRIFEPDLAVNGSNGGFTRLRIGQIKAHRTGFHQHRPHIGHAAHVGPEHISQGVRHKAQTDGLLARGAHPVLTLLTNPGHFPGNGRVVKEEAHRAIGRHLQLNLGEHIAQHRPEQAWALEEIAQLKRLHGMVFKVGLVAL